jgi:hypothetical protein
MNETPGSTTPPTAPSTAPSTPSPTSPSPNASAPSPAPPSDPYAGLDYAGMIQEHDIRGIDAGELATVYGPAHEVVNELVPGLRGFFDDIEQAGTPIGNDPGLIRALGSYGQAYRGLKRDEQTLAADVRRLAAASGVPVPPPPRVAPMQIGQGSGRRSNTCSAHMSATARPSAWSRSCVLTHNSKASSPAWRKSIMPEASASKP